MVVVGEFVSVNGYVGNFDSWKYSLFTIQVCYPLKA
jgi:hypothetical protein